MDYQYLIETDYLKQTFEFFFLHTHALIWPGASIHLFICKETFIEHLLHIASLYSEYRETAVHVS